MQQILVCDAACLTFEWSVVAVSLVLVLVFGEEFPAVGDDAVVVVVVVCVSSTSVSPAPLHAPQCWRESPVCLFSCLVCEVDKRTALRKSTHQHHPNYIST